MRERVNISKKIVAVGLSAILTVGMTATAFAMPDNPQNTETSIPAGETMENNWGTITSNAGTLNNNMGQVDHNSGTVNDNWGHVDNETSGVVVTNHASGEVSGGHVTDNYGGIVDGTIPDNDHAASEDPNPSGPPAPAPAPVPAEEHHEESHSEPAEPAPVVISAAEQDMEELFAEAALIEAANPDAEVSVVIDRGEETAFTERLLGILNDGSGLCLRTTTFKFIYRDLAYSLTIPKGCDLTAAIAMIKEKGPQGFLLIAHLLSGCEIEMTSKINLSDMDKISIVTTLPETQVKSVSRTGTAAKPVSKPAQLKSLRVYAKPIPTLKKLTHAGAVEIRLKRKR